MPSIAIVVIASPSPSHPSVLLIESFMASLELIPELNVFSVPILFVLDGYQICTENRTKKGRVTLELASNYEEFKIELEKYMSISHKFTNYRIHSLESHHGFAHAVRIGLNLCQTLWQTTYCLIAQHDRIFTCEFHGIHKLLKVIEDNTSIRYVGFPSVNNNSHNNVIQTRYRLTCLNTSDMIITVDKSTDLYLQPLIFWFDSQHICHIERYLQIYKPYINIPIDLRELFGMDIIGDMILRRGDFIEDRFGQSQLKSLTKLREQSDDDMMKRAFRWYGSYLVWIPDELYERCNESYNPPELLSTIDRKEQEEVQEEIQEEIQDPTKEMERVMKEVSGSKIQNTQSNINLNVLYPLISHRSKTMVRHLNGRNLDLKREARYEEYRIQAATAAMIKTNRTTGSITSSSSSSRSSSTTTEEYEIEIFSTKE